MGDEPLFCTRCGAEDKECEHGWERDDRLGPYCEIDYVHEWTDEDDTTARCIHCGMKGVLHVLKSERSGS